jgi:hypothetical protein
MLAGPISMRAVFAYKSGPLRKQQQFARRLPSIQITMSLFRIS